MVTFDTDICNYVINRKPGHDSILKRLDGREHGEIVLSPITLADYAMVLPPAGGKTLIWLKWSCFWLRSKSFPSTIELPSPTALRAHPQAQGTPIGPLDALIAAHALSLGATVVEQHLAGKVAFSLRVNMYRPCTNHCSSLKRL